MTLVEIEEDLQRRRVVFSLEVNPNIQNSNNSRVWCGVSEPGPFNRVVPILFHHSPDGPTETVEVAKQFSSSTRDGDRVKPIQYSDSGPTTWTVDVTYEIRPVRMSSIDTNYSSQDSLQTVAQHWRTNASEMTESYLNRIGQNRLRYQINFSIFGQAYNTVIPIFTSAPTQPDVEGLLDDFSIPCVTIVPDDSEYDPIFRSYPTRIETGVHQIS